MEIGYELYKMKKRMVNGAIEALTVGDECYSQNENLGQLIASFYQWNGYEIFLAFEAALTDANFHYEAERVQQLRIATFGK